MTESTHSNVPALGYQGRTKFLAFKEESKKRKAVYTEVEGILYKHGFSAFHESAVKQLKRQAKKRQAKIPLKERISNCFFFLEEFLEDFFREEWSNIFGQLFLLACILGGLGMLWAKIILTLLAGYAADLPGSVAAVGGLLSFPATLFSVWLVWCLWSLSPLARGWLFWDKVPIAEYQPPMSEDLYERLEAVQEALAQTSINAEILIEHGTVDGKKSFTDEIKCLSQQTEALERWGKEEAFVILHLTHDDGEKTDYVISQTWPGRFP
ncbi:MAG: hypothetical protein WDN67_03690 [Candidatus Moraniibacteriota bacterium]